MRVEFSLIVLREFLEAARGEGLDRSLHSLVKRRRQTFRDAVDPKLIDKSALDSRISVEWINTHSLNLPGPVVVADLAAQGLAVLPGEGFYWADSTGDMGKWNTRISLLKPEAEFKEGVRILDEYLRSAVSR